MSPSRCIVSRRRWPTTIRTAWPTARAPTSAECCTRSYERYAQERNLRGLLILSDGCDNGTVYPAHGEAARWRSLGGPVSTFSLGRSDTSSNLRDIAPDKHHARSHRRCRSRRSSPCAATIDAPRFETARIKVRLFLDNEEKLVKEIGPLKTTGTEIELTTDAPATPGEVKITVKADPLPGEASLANNEISTYLTVTKEGLSVLLVDRLRTELKFIREALAGDPRIRVFEAVRQTDDVPAGDEIFNFDKQAYDVIVLGDVTAKRLRAADPQALEKIEDLVKNKGVGLLMTGGADSFGNSDWAGTPIAAALPVELERGQSEDAVKMRPTQTGLTEYVMRLAPNPADNEAGVEQAAAARRLHEARPAQAGCRRDRRIAVARAALGPADLRQRSHDGSGRGHDLALDPLRLAEDDRGPGSAPPVLEATHHLSRPAGRSGRQRRGSSRTVGGSRPAASSASRSACAARRASISPTPSSTCNSSARTRRRRSRSPPPTSATASAAPCGRPKSPANIGSSSKPAAKTWTTRSSAARRPPASSSFRTTRKCSAKRWTTIS